ncbi:MAG TPA: S4 domain-containing protein [Brevundimonas sp.]|jgi:ribosome-associated heat shock protein Hsp15|uniref:S4 domain-containing protein n=1 Tax=Brevundimonas sp. TaxID=1871086 RepID=UPI002CC70CBC|nr:S4 domain-containing protein [Brevundimonas sp.]HRH19818.1 S4 domain-containing protein [Brevundimonas sp.]
MNEPACRIDIWLWRARFFKTRGLAARFVEDGRVRRTRPGRGEVRLDKASRTARAGDRLVFILGDRVVELTIQDVGTRRGPAEEAQGLYRRETEAS